MMRDNETASARELVQVLKTIRTPHFNLMNCLKFFYRPYICPFHTLLPFIEKKDKVLDIGCGAGQFIFLIRKKREPKRILGLEIEDSLIAVCSDIIRKNGFQNISVQKYNGRDLPDCAGEHTVFTMIDILHHIPRPLQLKYLDNVYGIMKEKDKLILKDIDASSPFVLFNKLHDLVLSRQISHERQAMEIKCFCEALGFKVLFFQKKRMVLYPHFTLVLQK